MQSWWTFMLHLNTPNHWCLYFTQRKYSLIKFPILFKKERNNSFFYYGNMFLISREQFKKMKLYLLISSLIKYYLTMREIKKGQQKQPSHDDSVAFVV